MYYFSGECSHIINIFDQEEKEKEKEKGPTKDKGNLYLSGVYVLQNDEV